MILVSWNILFNVHSVSVVIIIFYLKNQNHQHVNFSWKHVSKMHSSAPELPLKKIQRGEIHLSWRRVLRPIHNNGPTLAESFFSWVFVSSLSGAQLDVKWGNSHRKKGTKGGGRAARLWHLVHSNFRDSSCVLTCHYEIVVHPPFPAERRKFS